MGDTVNREAMRLLGSRRTKRKAKAARENGRLGGSPRLYGPCVNPHHRWKNGRCRFCGKSKATLLKEAKR